MSAVKAGRRALAALLAALALLGARPASAFCRATTCNPNNPSENCQREGLCLVSGVPLFWKSSCVTVGVQQDGSLTNQLSYDTVAEVVEQAFAPWTQAGCTGGGTPSIDVKLIGQIACGESEYNQRVGNANVVLFRQGKWPYAGAPNAIALTTSRFNADTGELWDADVELNSEMPLSVGDPVTGDDLLSVLTHEAGHFLGLSHSADQTATMQEVYTASEDGTMFRTLAQDDINGVCAIYPPGRKALTTSCEPRHGFSADCGADQALPDSGGGCHLNARAASGGPAPLSALGPSLLVLFLARARRRSITPRA